MERHRQYKYSRIGMVGWCDIWARGGACPPGDGFGGGFLGLGELFSTVALGLDHLHAQIRNRKISGTLVQGIEKARAVLASTPQGQALDSKFATWLVKQPGAGAVPADVSALVKRYADATRAEADAAQLSK